MNKRILTTIILSGLIAFFAADTSAATGGFVNFFATDGYNTIPRTAFSNEQPFVYMQLEIPATAIAVTSTGWNAPDGTSYFGSNLQVNDSTERWDTLNDWNNIKQSGNWRIYANYFDSKGTNQVVYTDITVTPEPATLALFAIGGIPLLTRKRKKDTA